MSKINQTGTSLVGQDFQYLKRETINSELTKSLINNAELTPEQLDEILIKKIYPLWQSNQDKKITPESVASVICNTIKYYKAGHELEHLHYVLFKKKGHEGVYDVQLLPDVRVFIKTVLGTYQGELDRIDTFIVTKNEIEGGKYKELIAPKRELSYEPSLFEDKLFKSDNIKVSDNHYYTNVAKGEGKGAIWGVLVVAYNSKNYASNFKLYPIPELIRIAKKSSNYYQGEWKGVYASDFQAMIEKTAIRKFCKFLMFGADSKQKNKTKLLRDEEDYAEVEYEVLETDSTPEKKDENILPEEPKKLAKPTRRKIEQKVAVAPQKTISSHEEYNKQAEQRKKEYFDELKERQKEEKEQTVASEAFAQSEEVQSALDEIKNANIPNDMKVELEQQLLNSQQSPNDLSEVDPDPSLDINTDFDDSDIWNM